MKAKQTFALKKSVLDEIVKANIPVYGFGLTTDELIDLAKSETSGAIPFAVSSPVAAPEGTKSGCVDEFEVLKRSIFYSHIDDLRQLSAER